MKKTNINYLIQAQNTAAQVYYDNKMDKVIKTLHKEDLLQYVTFKYDTILIKAPEKTKIKITNIMEKIFLEGKEKNNVTEL